MHKLRNLIAVLFCTCLLFQGAAAQTISKSQTEHGKEGINTAGINYYLEHLNQPISSNRHILSVEAAYSLAPTQSGIKASFIPRLNIGQYTSADVNYFEKTNLQYQIESYITLNRKTSFIANYSYSQAAFFAKHYAMLEGTYQIGQGWGAIGGVKMMYWDSAIMTYTLGAEKYVGNYWITLKPSLIMLDGKGFGGVNAGIRKYFAQPLNFIHLGASYGNSPEYANLNPDFKNLLSLSSYGGHILLQHQLHKHIYIRPAFTLRNEEYRDATWRTVWGVNIGLSYYF